MYKFLVVDGSTSGQINYLDQNKQKELLGVSMQKHGMEAINYQILDNITTSRNGLCNETF